MDTAISFAKETLHILMKQPEGTEEVSGLFVDDEAIPGRVLVINPHSTIAPMRREDDGEIAEALRLIASDWPDTPIVLYSWFPNPQVWPETLSTALEHGITQVAVCPWQGSECGPFD